MLPILRSQEHASDSRAKFKTLSMLIVEETTPNILASFNLQKKKKRPTTNQLPKIQARMN